MKKLIIIFALSLTVFAAEAQCDINYIYKSSVRDDSTPKIDKDNQVFVFNIKEVWVKPEGTKGDMFETCVRNVSFSIPFSKFNPMTITDSIDIISEKAAEQYVKDNQQLFKE